MRSLILPTATTYLMPVLLLFSLFLLLTAGTAIFFALGQLEVSEFSVKTAVINKRAGGMGLISGRKAFQRPMAEGIEILHAIQDVYLNDEVTIA